MSDARSAETVATAIDPLVAEARAAIGCWMSGTWRNPYAATQFARLLEKFIEEQEKLRLDNQALADTAAHNIDEKQRLQVALNNANWASGQR